MRQIGQSFTFSKLKWFAKSTTQLVLTVLTYKSHGHMQRILLKTLVKTSMLKFFMGYRNLCLYFLRWMI